MRPTAQVDVRLAAQVVVVEGRVAQAAPLGPRDDALPHADEVGAGTSTS